MPKRKFVKELSTGDSDLSPVPEGLSDREPSVRFEDGRASKKRNTGKVNRKSQGSQASTDQPQPISAPERNTRKRRTDVTKGGLQDDEVEEEAVPSPKKTPGKRRVSKDNGHEGFEDDKFAGHPKKRKRKTKAEKEAEMVEMPLAARTVGHKLYIGAHVSSAGGRLYRCADMLSLAETQCSGVHRSVLNSVHIGANSFALFLKSNQRWANPPLNDEHCNVFHAHCKTHIYDQAQHVLPHGSYLVNLAHTDKARIQQAYDAFLDDLRRCERLGIKLYNFHPGNNQCGDRRQAIAQLAANINKAHAATSSVVTLLENMAKGGNVIGSTFEDLRDTIDLVADKTRVGVCIDTCHSFAAGYDLRTPTAFHDTMDRFGDVVGMQYLRALHLNDSKAPFASYKDLHANIGTGFLGLRAFHNVVNEPRLAGLPLVLETPLDVRDDQGNYLKDEKGKQREDKSIWAREIKLLESLVGMDPDSEEFVTLEKQLARVGESERQRLTDQVERKRKKEEKKAEGAGKKGRNRKKDTVVEVEEETSLSELSEVEESGTSA